MPARAPLFLPRDGRLIPKPSVVADFEAALARRVPWSATTLSLAKIAFAVVLVAAAALGPSPTAAFVALLAFTLHAILDATDGVVARARGAASELGRVLDRLTDAPLILAIGVLADDVVPWPLLGARLVVDLAVLYFALRRGRPTENRPRTVLSGVTLLALLIAGLGLAPTAAIAPLVEGLTVASIVLGSVVALRAAGVLGQRRVADALSLANLACGVVGMVMAARGHPETSLALLLLGGLFDGLDGAAARRFGGSRYGVLVDDIADAVTYGVAPGFAIAVVVGGIEAAVLGALYAGFTVTRLVYFTLRKGADDPATFAGLPSTVGGALVLAALSIFAPAPLVVGAIVGAAMILMVSFDTRHAHLGRALARVPVVARGLAAAAAVLLAVGFVVMPAAAAAVTGALALAFALVPTAARLCRAVAARVAADAR